ncbi:hypothetical protein B0H21DRAFT_857366 [Amylocystis lapponica]|nr:hypothetical protein B0H21DRAFT_857366 [Amylocystis lapponica]
MASRTVQKSVKPITDPNVIKLSKSNRMRRQRRQQLQPTPANGLVNHPSSTVGSISKVPRSTAAKPPENTWSSLDMGGVSIKSIPPTCGLFLFLFLINLYLNHNALTSIPPEISKLRHLRLLDLSGNSLVAVPQELGMLTSLKELYLFDNDDASTGAGDPAPAADARHLGKPDRCIAKADRAEGGDAGAAKNLVSQAERDVFAADQGIGTFSVTCYNILCEKAATGRMYGYMPSWVPQWDYQKELILSEVLSHNADFCDNSVEFSDHDMSPSLRFAVLAVRRHAFVTPDTALNAALGRPASHPAPCLRLRLGFVQLG